MSQSWSVSSAGVWAFVRVLTVLGSWGLRMLKIRWSLSVQNLARNQDYYRPLQVEVDIQRSSLVSEIWEFKLDMFLFRFLQLEKWDMYIFRFLNILNLMYFLYWRCSVLNGFLKNISTKFFRMMSCQRWESLFL